MVTKQKFKDKVFIIYYEDSTKVTNSYLLNNQEIEEVSNQIEFSRYNKFDWKCIHLRDKKSYMQEIKAHNLLYRFNYKRDHTIDTDLEEDLSSIKALIYWLLGR